MPTRKVVQGRECDSHWPVRLITKVEVWSGPLITLTRHTYHGYAINILMEKFQCVTSKET